MSHFSDDCVSKMCWTCCVLGCIFWVYFIVADNLQSIVVIIHLVTTVNT
jgi:hypothetical protein